LGGRLTRPEGKQQQRGGELHKLHDFLSGLWDRHHSRNMTPRHTPLRRRFQFAYFFDFADFLEEDFLELVDFLDEDFFEPDDLLDFFAGTFLPFWRASESPIAMACLRLVTFLPLPPLLSVPRFRLCIARSTSLEALRAYFRAISVPPARRQFPAIFSQFLLKKRALGHACSV
jgi:hypothetical protein